MGGGGFVANFWYQREDTWLTTNWLYFAFTIIFLWRHTTFNVMINPISYLFSVLSISVLSGSMGEERKGDFNGGFLIFAHLALFSS